MDNKGRRIFIKRKDLRKLLSKKEWLYTLEITIIICFLISFISTLILSVASVDGKSMEPTYHNKDILLVSKTFYNIENGDIVVVNKKNMENAILKRVIASEGQTIDIDFDSGDVFVDGNLIEEKYIKEKTYTVGDISKKEYPLTVPKGCYFVMGDNRNNSMDSRYSQVGMVKKEEIFGEIIFKIWG